MNNESKRPFWNEEQPKSTKSKGDPMSQVILFFLAGAICLFAAVYIYGRSEDTAYHKVLEQYNKLVGDYSTVKKSNEQLGTSNTELTNKVMQLTGIIEQQTAKMDEVMKDCENAQTHCANMRESLIRLQDQVSKRRPVMKFDGPIQLEIISNKSSNPKSPHLKPVVDPLKTTPGKGLGRGIDSLMEKQDAETERQIQDMMKKKRAK